MNANKWAANSSKLKSEKPSIYKPNGKKLDIEVSEEINPFSPVADEGKRSSHLGGRYFDQDQIEVAPFQIGGKSINNHFDVDLNDRSNEPFNNTLSNTVFVNDHAPQQMDDLRQKRATKNQRLQSQKLEKEKRWLEKQFAKQNKSLKNLSYKPKSPVKKKPQKGLDDSLNLTQSELLKNQKEYSEQLRRNMRQKRDVESPMGKRASKTMHISPLSKSMPMSIEEMVNFDNSFIYNEPQLPHSTNRYQGQYSQMSQSLSKMALQKEREEKQRIQTEHQMAKEKQWLIKHTIKMQNKMMIENSKKKLSKSMIEKSLKQLKMKPEERAENFLKKPNKPKSKSPRFSQGSPNARYNSPSNKSGRTSFGRQSVSSLSKKGMHRLDKSFDSSQNMTPLKSVKLKIQMNKDLIDSKVLSQKEEAKLQEKVKKQQIYQEHLLKRKKLSQENDKALRETETKRKDNLEALNNERMRKLQNNIKKQSELQIAPVQSNEARSRSAASDYHKSRSPSKSPSRSSWMSTKKSKQEELREWANVLVGEPQIQPKDNNNQAIIRAEVASEFNNPAFAPMKKRKKKLKKKKEFDNLLSQTIDEQRDDDENIMDNSLAPMINQEKLIEIETVDKPSSLSQDEEQITQIQKSTISPQAQGNNIERLKTITPKGFNALIQNKLLSGMRDAEVSQQVSNTKQTQVDSEFSDNESEKLEIQKFKHSYVDKYGMDIEIPAQYVLDCQFYPGDTRYQVLLVNNVLPIEQRYKFVYHKFGQDYQQYPEPQNILDKKVYENLCLKLLKFENGYLQQVSDYYIDEPNKAIFSFSLDGKFMAIYLKKKFTLQIFLIEGKSIEKTFLNLDTPIYELNLNETFEILESENKEFSPFRMLFGVKSQYFVIHGTQKLAILALPQRNNTKIQVEHIYINNKEQFSRILNVQIKQESCQVDGKTYPYRCEVASLGKYFQKDKKLYIHNIHKKVLDLQGQYDSEVKSMYFGHIRAHSDKQNKYNKKEDSCSEKNHKNNLQVDPTEIHIQISQNFDKMLMCYKADSFILQKDPKTSQFSQQRLQITKHKKIKKIVTYGNEFLIVCCKDFDKELEILSTVESWSNKHEKSFRVSIKRQIEPNAIRAFDLMVVDNDEAWQSIQKETRIFRIKMLSARDQQVFVDNIQIPSEDSIQAWLSPFQNQLQSTMQSQEFTSQIQGPVEYRNYKMPKAVIYSQYFEQQTGFCSIWPYVSFQGILPKRLWLINMNKPDIINMLELPETVIEVINTEITQTNEYFVLCQSFVEGNIGYTMFYCDLDIYTNKETETQQQFPLTPIFSCTRQQIFQCIHQSLKNIRVDGINRNQSDAQSKVQDVLFNDMKVKDMHIRPSDKKNGGKNKLISFILVNDHLLSFTDGLVDSVTGLPLIYVAEVIDFKLTKLSDECFIYREMAKNERGNRIKNFKLTRLNILFDSYNTKTVLNSFQSARDFISSYSYDYQANILILLHSMKETNLYKYHLKLVDIEANKDLYFQPVTNSDFVGRIQTQIFCVLNGHFYYNNMICKMRYDLIRSGESNKESDCFDFYNNVFDLQKGEQVTCMFPFVSMNSHKLIYITQQNLTDNTSLKENGYLSKRIICMPFLHARKIFTGVINPNHSYFNLTLPKQLYDDTQQIDELQNANTLAKIKSVASLNTHYMVSINFTDGFYRVYDASGIQKIIRYFKKGVIDVYGKTLAVSPNGRIFAFVKKSLCHNEMVKNQQEGLPTSPHNLCHLKDIKTSLSILQINLKPNFTNGFEIIKENIQIDSIMSSFSNDLQHLKLENVSFHCEINNNGSVAYGLQTKFYYQIFLFGQESNRCFNFYKDVHQEFRFNKNTTLINVENKIIGFALNDKYLIAWSNNDLFCIPLQQDESQKQDKTQEQVQYVDVDLKTSSTSKIRKVIVGCCDWKIGIEIEHLNGFLTVICWDINKNQEITSVELDQKSEIVLDDRGDIYSVQGDTVTILSKQVRLKCFQTQYIFEHPQNQMFGFSKGIRIDSQDNEWMFLKDFVLLPFSYMTFLIRQKFREMKVWKHQDYIFDIEQYNFIFQKKTYFTIDENVCLDFDQLKFVLSNFKRRDPILLDLLMFATNPQLRSKSDFDDEVLQFLEIQKREKDQIQDHLKKGSSLKSNFQNRLLEDILIEIRKIKAGLRKKFDEQLIPVSITPLHIAFWNKQQMVIKLILDFMSMIERKRVHVFSDILPFLIEQNGFSDFLNSFQFQTYLSAQKISIYQDEKWNDEIVTMCHNSSCHVDANLFRSQIQIQFRDDKTYHHLVQVKIMQIEWIINTESGKKFLTNLYNTQNLQIFDEPATLHIISYLFYKFRPSVLYHKFPVYVFQMLVIFGAMMMNPTLEDDGYIHYKPAYLYVFWKTICAIVLIVITITMIPQIFNQGLKEFLNKSANIFTIVYIVLCSMITYNIHIEHDCRKILPEHGKIRSEAYKHSVARRAGYEIFDHECAEAEKFMRKIQTVANLLMMFRLLFFLQLNDTFAPVISSIYIILWSIRYFVVVTLILIIALAQAFYQIGQNQLQFDLLPIGNEPPYVNKYGSLKFVFDLTFYQMFPEIKTTSTQFNVVMILTIFTTIMMFLVLMNILIAFMANVQTQELQHQQRNRLIYQLGIVVDNWVYNPLKNDSKTKYLYIVLPSNHDSFNEDQELIEEAETLQKRVKLLRIKYENLKLN